LKPDALYPIFWSMQASFSQPKRLFDQANFKHFKFGLEATMANFKQIKNDHGSRTVAALDETKGGAKRKRKQPHNEELADTYNPKYLTSRDLFELEVKNPR
jgi:THO complex subunit 1